MGRSISIEKSKTRGHTASDLQVINGVESTTISYVLYSLTDAEWPKTGAGHVHDEPRKRKKKLVVIEERKMRKKN